MDTRKTNTQVLKNICYMLNNWFCWNKQGAYFSLLKIPVLILIPTISAFVPKIIIEAITIKVPLNKFFLLLLCLSLIIVFLNCLDPYLNGKLALYRKNVNMRYSILAFNKLLRINYFELESYECRYKFERAKKFAQGDQGIAATAIDNMVVFAANVLGIATYSAILGNSNPIMLLIVIFASLLEFVFTYTIMKIDLLTGDKQTPQKMKFSYFYRVALSPETGKDIRIYKIKDWLYQWITKTLVEYVNIINWYTKQTIKY